MNNPKFSLLLCVYEKDNPRHLQQCLDSILALETKPDELVIVKDGPLTDELEQVLNNTHFPFETNIIALPENVTLGPARAKGVEAAKHEWVAIMDSDDICRADRFCKQLAALDINNSDILNTPNPPPDIIGGQIEEFLETPGDLGKKRSVPETHEDIVKYAKKRSPFNHMTVMFRRSAVVKAGNYKYFPLFEDYDLWARLIISGAHCMNLPDVLVDARVDMSTYERRRGMRYLRSEIRLHKSFLKLGFIGIPGFIRNIIIRIPVRLLPSGLLIIFYNKALR